MVLSYITLATRAPVGITTVDWLCHCCCPYMKISTVVRTIFSRVEIFRRNDPPELASCTLPQPLLCSSTRLFNTFYPTMSDDETKPAPPTTKAFDASAPLTLTERDEIEPYFIVLDDYPQFEPVAKDVNLDPHDNSYDYTCFRTKNGGRLTREVLEKDFILVGNDKAGLSGVLDIPVPPGGTLSVQLSTWINPCHSGFAVSRGYCFGVGMVPYGEGKEQVWSRGELETCIIDGVQYYACLSIQKMLYGSGGRDPFGGGMGMGSFSSFAAMASMSSGGGDGIERSFQVLQDGEAVKTSAREELGLDTIDVRIKRDVDGTTEFSFVHQDCRHKITRPGDDKKDMQLYLNCLGWADNNTYVQIHAVDYKPPANTSDTKAEDDVKQAASFKKGAVENISDAE